MTWHVSKPDGETIGPLTTEQIVRAVHEGEIPADSLVRGADSDAWLPIDDVPALNADEAQTLVLGEAHKAELERRLAERRAEASDASSPGDEPAATKARPPSGPSLLVRGRDLLGRSLERLGGARWPARLAGRRRILLLGGLGVVVLVAAFVLVSAARARSHPLFLPCLDDVLSSMEEGARACGAFSLQTKGTADGFEATIDKVPRGELARLMPRYLGELLPNLPEPTTSRGRGCIGQPAGDLGGSSVKVLGAYHAAAERARRCARTGGLRAAVFTLEDQQLSARSELDDETGQGRIRLTSPPAGALDATWKDLPWEVAHVEPPFANAHVEALDRKMEKDGWWPGDAGALVDAANAAEIEADEATHVALAVVARWLRHSNEWAAATRATMYSQCIQVKSELLARKDPEASFRAMAGVTPAQAAAIVEPIGATESRRDAFAARFDAAIGSALHAECAVTIGCPLTKPDGYDPAVRASLEASGTDTAARARRLICHRDFQRALGETLSRARGRLVARDTRGRP